MEFVKRVVRIPKPYSLSSLEKGGDPEALAASLVELGVQEEKSLISTPRASSIYDACMRMHVIGTMENIYSSQKIGVKGRLIYGIGRAAHYWIQNSPEVFGDRRVGFWLCSACGKTRYWGRPPRKPCEHCGAGQGATIYEEYGTGGGAGVKDKYPVTGHPDLFLWVGKGAKVRLVEVKTMEETEYEKLIAPLISHVWQVQTYMWKCSEEELGLDVDPNVCYVMYVAKRMKKDRFPFKVFVVERDEGLLKRIKDKTRLYALGVKGYPRRIPPLDADCERTEWESWKAKSCPALEVCKCFQKGEGSDA